MRVENPENIIYQCQRLKQEGQQPKALDKREDLAKQKAQQELEDRIALEQARKRIGELFSTNTHP